MRLDRLDVARDERGRFASVTFDCTRKDNESQHEIDLRWRSVRQKLADQGVPQRLQGELGERLTEQRGAGAVGRLVVGHYTPDGDATIVADRWLPDPPEEDRACCGPVPDLRSLARALQRYPAYLTVALDRTGADLAAYAPLGERVAQERVAGEHDVVHKVRAGDASQQRLQRRAEDSWQQNAALVAKRIDELTQQHHPVAVFVAGDERAVGWLRDQVSASVRARVRPLGSRGPGVLRSRETLAAVARTQLDVLVSEDIQAALAQFLQVEGRQDRAAQGRRGVGAALRRGQVARLLVADPAPRSTTALADDGLPEPADGAAREHVETSVAMIAAGAATGADVTLVPAEAPLTDGVAAVLRWSDAATPRDSARSMPGHGEGGGW